MRCSSAGSICHSPFSSLATEIFPALIARRIAVLFRPTAAAAERCAARELTGDPVSYCVLAHGSRVFWPWPAWIMAPGGHWRCAVVAICFRRRLASQREAHTAVHHP